MTKIQKVSSKKKISLIGPAKNEEKNLPEFIEKAKKALEKLSPNWEIIIINDGSQDKSAHLLEKISRNNKRIKVITNRKSLGLTKSVRTGMELASGQVIVFLPTDLESDPEEDIPKMVSPIFKGEADFTVGWRQGKKVSKVKSTTSYLFNLLSFIFFRVKFHDLAWIKAVKKEALAEMPKLRSDWQKFFAIIAHYQGFNVVEVKTNWHPRKHGKSNFGSLGLKRIPRSFIDLINLWLLLNFKDQPMQLFGRIGIAFLLTGLLLGSYIVYTNFILLVNIDNHIPLVILSSLLIFTGTQIVALGFLAEIIVGKD